VGSIARSIATPSITIPSGNVSVGRASSRKADAPAAPTPPAARHDLPAGLVDEVRPVLDELPVQPRDVQRGALRLALVVQGREVVEHGLAHERRNRLGVGDDGPALRCVMGGACHRNDHAGGVIERRSATADWIPTIRASDPRGELLMPRISSLYGITVLAGSLPSRALSLVHEWGRLHKAELLANWDRVQRLESLVAIDPLP
jgi:hypothetical protein